MKLILFGVSNILSDLFDCALAIGLTPSKVVTNVAENLRPRTKSLAERVAALPSPPAIIALNSFVPGPGECYFLGTTAPSRPDLVREIEQKFAISFATLVHPRAYVSPLAVVAEGVFVGAGAIVAAGAVLGRHVFINRGASIGHDTVVEPFARLMPGCDLGGHVRIGAGATIGMGANVLQEVHIGADSLVTIGAVVVRDVPDGHIAAGSPARTRSIVPDGEVVVF